MSISSTTQDLAKDGQATSLAVFFLVPHICPKAVPPMWPANWENRYVFDWQKQKSRCIHEEHTCLICLFSFAVVYVISFSLLGDEVYKILPNGFAISGGLLLHPVLLLLCLLL